MIVKIQRWHVAILIAFGALIVLSVVFIVVALSLPKEVQSDAFTTQRRVMTIAAALEIYYQERGEYPPEAEGLSVLEGLKESYLVDAWGNPIRYELVKVDDQSAYVVCSSGENGVLQRSGESDDICYSPW